MAQEIVVPEVSDGVTEGTVISLAVAVGDTVEVDQTLLELETDKAVVSLPAPFAGVITGIKVAEGETVQVGAVVMLGEPGGAAAPGEEAPGETQAPAEPEPAAPAAAPSAVTEPLPPSPAAAPPPPPADTAYDQAVDLGAVRSGDQVAPAAPSIRRLARDLGVDIHQVQGTGPGSRIGEDDVRAFVREAMRNLSGGPATPGGEFFMRSVPCRTSPGGAASPSNPCPRCGGSPPTP